MVQARTREGTDVCVPAAHGTTRSGGTATRLDAAKCKWPTEREKPRIGEAGGLEGGCPQMMQSLARTAERRGGETARGVCRLQSQPAEATAAHRRGGLQQRARTLPGDLLPSQHVT